MSTGTQLVVKNQEQIRAIATQAREFQTAIAACTDEFEKGLLIAEGMNALRDSMTEEIVRPLAVLQGSGLGFRTDKDKDGGYDWTIVRDCTIEAWLRGFYHVGNEFNIIAGRFYGAKAGFERKVKTFPGMGSVQFFRGKPEVSGAEAAMDYIAQWELNGEPHKLERIRKRLAGGGDIDLRIVVRVNSGMIIDAIWGKGDAKMWHAIWDELTNHKDIIPAADEDVVTLNAAPAEKKIRKSSLFDESPTSKPVGPDAEEQGRLVDEYLQEVAAKTQPAEVAELHKRALNEQGKTLTRESIAAIAKACSDRQGQLRRR